MTLTAPKVICALILAAAAPVSAQAANGGYAVPPSPYGQVGNPFLAPVQLPTFPTQAPAPTKPTLISQQPVVVAQAPKPAPVRAAPPKPAPKPAPVSAPVSAPPAVATVAPDDGYQVPATSKYAARINAARAATGQMATASAPPEPVSAPVSAPVPTPAPTTNPAADHVFVPGEHYSDASQAPRQYSLHRQWGLTPDKIQVDHTATGALLTLTDVPGSGKMDSGTTDKDTPTEDDGAEALPPAKTATP